MTKTEQNLWEAFAGESQANRKYLAFAEKADKEGHKQAARLFRAAAAAETVHAHGHLRLLKGVGSTEENLRAAISGETHEFENMYPQMIEDAKAEDNRAAARYFGFANTVEEQHAGLYTKVLESLENPAETEYHVCGVCGETSEGEAPEKCPVCGAPASSYMKID
ncbi:MAG: rubrerythrin family protein [Desulfovibrio sp.]